MGLSILLTCQVDEVKWRNMNWTALSRHAFRLVVGLAAALAASAVLRQADFDRFTAPDVEGLNTLIALIGSIYAVVFAFVIFVIWGQFTAVEEATLRECSLLNELLRFSQYLDPDASRSIRRSLTEYAKRAGNYEWHALGEGRKDPATEKSFAALIATVMKIEQQDERLIDITRKLAEQRDQRIAKSLTRIPPTLLMLVRTMVVAIVLLVFIYPFHSWMLGAACFSIVVVILFFSNLVMTDTDNPFDGVFNVSPQPFLDLAA
jgi:hypothetical protein